MRTQLSPSGDGDELKFELSSDDLARIDYKSFNNAGTIENPVGSKTNAKQRRKDDKHDQFIQIDDVELVFSYGKKTNKLKGNKLCKVAYNKSIITLALVKRLWNDIKNGKVAMYYNCITGEVETD